MDWDTYGDISAFNYSDSSEVISGSISDSTKYLSQQNNASKIILGASSDYSSMADPYQGIDVYFPVGGYTAMEKLGCYYGSGGWNNFSWEDSGSGETGGNAAAMFFY